MKEEMYSRELQGTNANGEPLRSMYVVHTACDLDCSHDGRTRQEYADDCDINKLLERYEKAGIYDIYNPRPENYLDVSNVPDLQESLNVLRKAEEAFMSLPAATRREFDNDPIRFVEFAQDEKNVEKMREWKLAAPAPEEPKPVKVEMVNPPAESSVPAPKAG